MKSSHPSSLGTPFPLTLPQRAIWFDQMLHGAAPLYNIGGYMRLHGALDVELFKRSAKLLVRKHDVLRMALVPQADGDEADDTVPMQACTELAHFDVALHDLSEEPDPEKAASAWMVRSFAEPFELHRAPLFRYALLKLSGDAFLYFACYHHLIADGWTIALLARSHAEIYTALLAGQQPDLDAPSYRTFADNDLNYVASPVFATQRNYWRHKFQSVPEPLLVPRHGVLADEPPSRCKTLTLPRDGYDRLAAFAHAQGATTFHAILAALYVYFTRTAQRGELTLGLPVLNRANAAFKATAGLFVGMAAVRLSLSPGLSFPELMQAIGRELRQDYRHQRFPISTLHGELGCVSADGQQLFDISVSYERHDYRAAFGQVSGIALPMVNGHQVTPLTLFVREFSQDAPVRVDFAWRCSHFNDEEIESLQNRLVRLLEAVQQAPEVPISTLPIVTQDEYRLLTQQWNATSVDYPRALPVHVLIEQQARATPEALAVVFETQQLSYRTLNTAANRLAHRLIAAGVTADALVGICAERSVEMVVGLLAILKAGGAYVPLDPGYPRARLAYMLADAGMRWLLTQAALWDGIDLAQPDMQVMDLCLEDAAGFPEHGPAIAIHPGQLAYMIYTSGSTGQPKGAGIAHAGLTNRLLWMQDAYALTAHDRVLQKTPFGFDVSVWEFFWPLMSGATLVVARPGDHKDPARLAELIQRESITTLHFVPPMLRMFVEHGALRQCTSLRQVMASGEALPAELARRFLEQSPATLHNLYGPTEASIDVTAWPCTADPGSTVPIGRPIANTRIHLLDEAMEPVPVGVAGELYIGGVQLARGYHGRPELTAERFVPDPFSGLGERLYRSGDLARWRRDGTIEYIGRTDDQVKIRGNRIELGEIEAQLLACAGVADAAVVTRKDANDEWQVLAYWVPVKGGSADAQALREGLTACLPAAMVPAGFVALEQLPIGINGKVDRKGLANRSWEVPARQVRAPATSTEEQLAAIWSTLLHRSQIGRDDHFFHIGGHSLLAVRLRVRLREVFALELPLQTIFNAPRLHQLASAIDQIGPDRPLQRRPQRADRSLPLPLSFAQQRLWFFDQLEPGSRLYNMPSAVRLVGELNVGALESAFNGVVARHEVLRTTYELDGDSPVQVVAEQVRVPFALTDLSQLPPQERLPEARRCAENEAAQGFDLRVAPVLRVRLLRLNAREHWLLVTMHHIASDGWSVAILLRELSALYAALRLRTCT